MAIDNSTISVIKPFNPPAAPVSNLLFASNFAANSSIAAFTLGATTARAFLSGTDAETGFAWPVSGGGSGQALNTLWTDCYLIPYQTIPVTLTSENINSYGKATIRTVTGPDGTPEKTLFMEVLDAGKLATGSDIAHGAQMPFELLRITDSTPTPPALDDIYMSYYFKRPGGLLADLPAGGNAVISELKTGGHAGLYGGDLRIILNIFKDAAGSLYWRTECDRRANGTMSLDPSGILGFDPDTGAFKYWQESNKSVPVVLDAWNKCEIYIHRHAKNGIVLIAINDQIVCYHVGRTIGEFGYQWGRIIIQNVYGSHKIGSAEVARVRLRDSPPPGSVLQAHAASLLYKYAA